uniref:KIND domain-containing protein n=1 Tax=Timema douglasi TaxID=61478 RepID=A0A7R8V9V2_TIMDO|nr:unnamed protein product [Timema douglasi]
MNRRDVCCNSKSIRLDIFDLPAMQCNPRLTISVESLTQFYAHRFVTSDSQHLVIYLNIDLSEVSCELSVSTNEATGLLYFGIIPSLSTTYGQQSSSRNNSCAALVDVIGVLWKVVRGFREMTVEGLVDWRKAVELNTTSALANYATEADDSREIHQETDDEGIERDSGDSDEDYIQHCSLDRVLEHCSLHLAAPSAQEADSHYRAVCRALVAEALELSSFLDKVSQGTQELQNKAEAHSTDLDNLKFSDWVSSEL